MPAGPVTRRPDDKVPLGMKRANEVDLAKMGVRARPRSRLNIKISKVGSVHLTGHEDFLRPASAIIDEQHAATRLSRPRAKHARCASAYNNGIKTFPRRLPLSNSGRELQVSSVVAPQREKRLKMVFI